MKYQSHQLNTCQKLTIEALGETYSGRTWRSLRTQKSYKEKS